MAKKKIKKLLKKVAPLLAVAGLGKAFMDSRNRKASIDNNMAKEFGFGQMNLKDYGPYSIGTKRSQMPRIRPRMMDSNELSDDLMEYDQNQDFGFGLMAKKGGRIVKGKKAAVRTKGFGKKKKQANRSKKK
jgi:hypothetical protein